MCAAYYFISFFPIPQPLNLGRYLLSYPVELQDGLSEKLVWCNTKVGVCVCVCSDYLVIIDIHIKAFNIFLYSLQDYKDGMLLFYQQGIKMHL